MAVFKLLVNDAAPKNKVDISVTETDNGKEVSLSVSMDYLDVILL
jgi:hypothetical protein